MYSRKPLLEVKKNLQSLRVDYAILEDSWCVRRSRYDHLFIPIDIIDIPGYSGRRLISE